MVEGIVSSSPMFAPSNAPSFMACTPSVKTDDMSRLVHPLNALFGINDNGLCALNLFNLNKSSHSSSPKAFAPPTSICSKSTLDVNALL